MPKGMRVWKIGEQDNLEEISRTKLDLEERIENWIAEDISLISENLLIIGRQVTTDFGKIIDLLCLDQNGDVVILELKRDKTYRDITGQVLDYASWVQELSHDRITEIADSYLDKTGNSSLEDAFRKKFNDGNSL